MPKFSGSKNLHLDGPTEVHAVRDEATGDYVVELSAKDAKAFADVAGEYDFAPLAD